MMFILSVFSLLLSRLLLLYFATDSSIDDANSLELCSKVFAVLATRFDMCLELSFACCSVDFMESRFEKTKQFVSLNAETALSAKLPTNLVYAFVMESGVVKLAKRPLKLSLYGLHAD